MVVIIVNSVILAILIYFLLNSFTAKKSNDILSKLENFDITQSSLPYTHFICNIYENGGWGVNLEKYGLIDMSAIKGDECLLIHCYDTQEAPNADDLSEFVDCCDFYINEHFATFKNYKITEVFVSKYAQMDQDIAVFIANINENKSQKLEYKIILQR